MKDMITLESRSSLFTLYQPDSYSSQEDMWLDESFENDSYEEMLDEEIDGVKRRDLPPDHDEYLEEGYFDLDGKKYLDDYLIKGWFRAFCEVLENRDHNIKIEAVLTGSWSPREYNFNMDKALFTLKIAEKDLTRIYNEVMTFEPVFAAYLKKYHSHKYQTASWVPNTVEGWKAHFWTDKDTREGEWTGLNWQRAVHVLLDFWLFAFPKYAVRSTYTEIFETVLPSLEVFEKNTDDFRKLYDDELEKLKCNGAVTDCCDFIPGKPEECEAACEERCVPA